MSEQNTQRTPADIMGELNSLPEGADQDKADRLAAEFIEAVSVEAGTGRTAEERQALTREGRGAAKPRS